ncbi:MAG: sensor histidine kinase [Lachnospiraceae bacterium]|nr:sensor histidine kinase [Lachnospiraceae bacterium]
MRQKVSSNSIFRQLVVNSLIISIIPIALGAAIIFRIFSGMSREIARSSYEQLATQYMFDLEEKISQADVRLNHLSVDSVIIDGLTGADKVNPIVAGTNITDELTKILQLNSGISYHNCMVYSLVDSVPVYGRYAASIKEAEREGWYREDRLKDGERFYYTIVKDNSTIFSVVREIRDIDAVNLKSNVIGYIKLDLNAKNFFKTGNRRGDEGTMFEVLVVGRDNVPAYATGELSEELTKLVLSGNVEPQTFVEVDDKLLYVTGLDSIDCKIALVFDNKAYSTRRRKVFFPVALTFLLLIVAIVLLSYFFAKQFSKRVNILVDKIKRVKHGNFDETEPIGGNDEIAELDNAFLDMQKELNHLIDKNYIQTLINKEYELKNLQLQINPHFLYNTLESISSLSAVSGNFEICEICEKLGEVFRYSLGRNYGNYVSLAQEIKHIQNYVYIQKIRFGDKFEVYYNIPEKLMNCQILRFILQPIVENAIIHGIIPKNKEGNIEISATRSDSNLIITVEDDGVGMTKEKENELKEYIHKESTLAGDDPGSIGVRNVHKRIELTCGPNYGIEIKTMQNKGSRFEIWLPYIERGNKL